MIGWVGWFVGVRGGNWMDAGGVGGFEWGGGVFRQGSCLN